MKDQSPRSPENPFDLGAEAMRELGYRAVDALVDHAGRVRNRPVVGATTAPEDLRALRRPFPVRGSDPVMTVEQAVEQVFGNTMMLTHPRFFAYIPGPGNFISALAEFLASGYNVFAGTTPHNLGAFEVERVTIDWLGSQFGWTFPSSGLFVSGGSAASFTALAIARHVHLQDQFENVTVYCSTQTHSCIERALSLLGFKPDQIRVLEPDPDYRLRGGAVTAAIRTDRAAGRRPFCVVGTAGTTNTGAIDYLDELAEVCERERLWFHVDAAFGGGAVLSDHARTLFAGIERAHTIAVDPHKWLFQPFECACVLGRQHDWFRDTFRRVPAYMRDTDAEGDQFNYRDMGLQVTRSFKAFKLWLSLHVYGTDAFRDAVNRGLELARYAQQYVDGHDAWEVVTPATLGVLTFRYRAVAGNDEVVDRFNARIAKHVNRSGFAYVTTTELSGRLVLRICPIHPAATREDIDGTFARLEAAACRPTPPTRADADPGLRSDHAP